MPARLSAASALAFAALPLTEPALSHPCTDRSGETLVTLRVDDAGRLYDGKGQELALADIVLTGTHTPALHALADGQNAHLSYQGTDRYGRPLVHIVLQSNDRWLQGALLSAGAALADPPKSPETCRAALLADEQKARQAASGVWRDTARIVRTPETVEPDGAAYRIVQGHVVSTADRQGTVFLNFGPDWRTDFTIRITGDVRRRFKRETELDDLDGRMVEVRGWVGAWDGPVITLGHTGRLRVIPDP